MFQLSILKFRSSTKYYLVLVSVALIGSQLFLYLGYGNPVLAGQSLGIVFFYAITPMVLFLWFLAPTHNSKSTKLRLVISSFIALCVVTIFRTFSDNGSVNYTAFLVPIILLMVLLKPPNLEDARDFSLVTALLFVATIPLAQLLNILDIRLFRDYIPMRWLPEIAGGFRWEGIFGDPNNAGFIAVFLIVFAISSQSKWKYPILGFGGIVLLISESRSALFALATGVMTLILMNPRFRKRINSRTTYFF